MTLSSKHNCSKFRYRISAGSKQEVGIACCQSFPARRVYVEGESVIKRPRKMKEWNHGREEIIMLQKCYKKGSVMKKGQRDGAQKNVSERLLRLFR